MASLIDLQKWFAKAYFQKNIFFDFPIELQPCYSHLNAS